MSLSFGKFRFLLRTVLVFLAVFFFMGSTNSFAYIQMSWTNPNGVKYKINDTSFTTNLKGSSLTKAEGRYWVQTGLSKWTTQTGLDFDIDYRAPPQRQAVMFMTVRTRSSYQLRKSRYFSNDV